MKESPLKTDIAVRMEMPLSMDLNLRIYGKDSAKKGCSAPDASSRSCSAKEE